MVCRAYKAQDFDPEIVVHILCPVRCKVVVVFNNKEISVSLLVLQVSIYFFFII